MAMRFHSILTPVLVLALGQAVGAAAVPLSLLGDRLHVEAAWRTADGLSGLGTPVRLTDETGYFWFFSPTNVEVVVKGLDACASGAPRFWVFAGGLTDAEITLTVTDQATGQQKIYRNPQGRAFQPIQDTDAFATCAVQRCGHGSFVEMAATPRANYEIEAMALAMGGGLTASQPLYDRVAADMASIRLQKPELNGLHFGTPYELRTLNVAFDLPTAAAVSAGEYHAWDCLNRWYGLEEQNGPYSGTTMVLHFGKILDLQQLVAEYQTLPGVTQAFVDNGGILVYPPVGFYGSICGKIDGSRNHYFIRQPGGPLGTIFYFRSEPGAAPQYVGSTAGDASDWILAAQQCLGV